MENLFKFFVLLGLPQRAVMIGMMFAFPSLFSQDMLAEIPQLYAIIPLHWFAGEFSFWDLLTFPVPSIFVDWRWGLFEIFSAWLVKKATT